MDYSTELCASAGAGDDADALLHRRIKFTRCLLEHYETIKKLGVGEDKKSGPFWDLVILSAGGEAQK